MFAAIGFSIYDSGPLYLPKIEINITTDSKISGILLAHENGYWFVIGMYDPYPYLKKPLSFKPEPYELIAIPDSKAGVVWSPNTPKEFLPIPSPTSVTLTP
jgi:hypothetical protein